VPGAAAVDPVPGLAENLTGNFTSHSLSGRFEFGLRDRVGPVTLSPFTAVQFSNLWMDGFTEHGNPGTLALYYAPRSTASVPTFLGAQLDTKVELSPNRYLIPWIRAAWVHEFARDRSIEPSFVAAPGYSFTIAGPKAAADAAQVNAGLRIMVRHDVAVFARFDGEFSGVSRSYAGTAGVTVRW
jgi:outer membrane autotransporter protein